MKYGGSNPRTEVRVTQVYAIVDYTAGAGTLQFTSATFAQAENVATANLTVSRTGGSAGAVSVQCADAGTGSATLTSDYTMTSPQTLNWADGDVTNKNCVVTIVNDTRDEINETVNVLLQNVGGGATIGAQSTSQLSITDDDPTPTVTFTSGSQSSAGESGTMTITAQLSAASGQIVTVPYTVNGASTATGTDYSISGTFLTFNPGSTTATITITIATDALDENNETVIVNMGAPTNATQGATTTHIATITDDDATPTVQWTAASQASANETNGATMTVTAQLSAVSGLNVSVPFTVTGTATGGGTDYTITPTPPDPIAINAGSSTGTATITIVGDVIPDGNETVILTIGSPTNAGQGVTLQHTATITDDDGPVCTRNAPTFSISPATKIVKTNQSVVYTLSVTNNDTAECADSTTFNIAITSETGDTAAFTLPSVRSSNTVSVAAGGTTNSSVTLTVSSNLSAVTDNALTSTLTISDAVNHTGMNQSDSVTTTVANFNPMIHSSSSTSSTKWGGSWGVSGGKYGEFTCGTCHAKGTGNIKRVKTSISTPDLSNWAGSGTPSVAVTLAATTGANSFGDDGRGTLTSSNMVCEVCHSTTSVHRYNSSTGVTDFNHQSSNQGDCISCHPHNKGFDASCTTCHGNPPVDAGTLVLPSSRPTGSTTAGAHNTHVATFNIACARCHYNSAGSGATHNVNGQVSLGFVNLPTGTGGVSSGSYNGQASVTYNVTDAGTSVSSGGTKTCTNYCHGSTIGGTGAVWDNPATADCGDCHGAAAATPPTRVNHPRHVGNGAGQLGLTCDMCHGLLYSGGSAPPDHLTGSVRYDVSSLTGNTPTYRGFSTVQQTGTLAPSGTYGTCGNVYCHSNVQSSNGTAAASVYATPTWGDASVPCDSCHGQANHLNGQPNSGSHEIHVTTLGYTDCNICHSGAGNETALHANGTINISISATYGATATYNQGSHAPGSGGYGTCSNVTCHNMKTSFDWGTTGTCTMCHTVGGTNSVTVANPVSGLHNLTAGNTTAHDDSFGGSGNCGSCHAKASISGHWDGAASGATPSYTKAQVGITATWYTDDGGTAAKRGSCYSPSPATGLDGCHSDGGEWRRQWSTEANVNIATSPNPAQPVCNVCHGQSGAWNEGTSHYRSGIGAAEDKGFTAHTDPNPNECEDCHAYDSAAVHNSNNKIDFSGGGTAFTLTMGTHGTNPGWYCFSASCHTSTQGAVDATSTSSRTFLDSKAFPGSGSINYVTGTSTPEGSCFGCHGDGVAEYWPQNAGNVRASDTMSDYNNAGAHQKHMEILAARLGYTLATASDPEQQAMCAYCHALADGDHMTIGVTGSHIAETFATGGKKSLWNATDSDATFNTTNYNCTNVDCHNSQDSTTTYSWYSGTTSTCTMCHTVGGSNTATTAHPASGIHDVARITGKLHDDAFTYNNGAGNGNCVTCHTSSPTTGVNKHIDGGNDYSIGIADGADPKVNLAAAVGFTDAAVPTCAPTQANGCHSEQWQATTKHTWTHLWHDSAGASDGQECQGCHGTFTQTWRTGVSPDHTANFDGQADGAEVRLNHDHGAASETEFNQCISCHVYNDALYGTMGWNPTAANKHGNGQIEMLTAMGYATASNTCSNTCHGTEVGSHAMTPDSGWTVANTAGPALVCTGCHTGSGTGALKVGPSSPHVIRGTKAGMNTFSSCDACHPEHTGGLLISNNANAGISYTAGGRTGFRLGGTATTGATEAEICWNCHSNTTTYQAAEISEWGLNTGGTYNYGSVTAGNLNWTTTSWSSANANFSYKNGPLYTRPIRGDATNASDNTTRGDASIHATGGTVGTQSNTLAQVRCSYCHDVHDTYGAVNGKPFLRGNWRVNPYKEDGAPRSAAQTYSATENFGAVPRGGGTNLNVLGGWQIDINNGNPNSGAYTYASNDALCASCHTQAAIETAAPLHKNSVKGFTNDTTATTTATNRNILRVGAYTGTDYHPSRGGTMTAHSSAVGAPRMGYNVSTDTGSTATEQNGLRDVARQNAWVSGYGIYNLSGTNATRYAYQAIPLSAAGVVGVTQDLTTVQADYHSFTCSKCHNPHASRLPRLMITNCLDVNNNTWDDILTLTTNPLYTRSTANNPANINTLAYFSSAQNCHRYTENASGAARGTVMEKGWNAVTPW